MYLDSKWVVCMKNHPYCFGTCVLFPCTVLYFCTSLFKLLAKKHQRISERLRSDPATPTTPTSPDTPPLVSDSVSSNVHVTSTYYVYAAWVLCLEQKAKPEKTSYTCKCTAQCMCSTFILLRVIFCGCKCILMCMHIIFVIHSWLYI